MSPSEIPPPAPRLPPFPGPVLITGAAGFIGANLVRALLARGAEAHAIVRPSTSRRRLEGIEGNLRLHAADLARRDEAARAVAAIAPRIVFHAASGGATAGPQGRAATFESNVAATANLLAALEAAPPGPLVHLGSSLEYGRLERPLREEDPPAPFTLYGATKAAASLLVREWSRASGRPTVILRIFSVYGPFEGEGRLVPTAIRAAFRGEPLPLTGPGLRRDYIHVDDVVEACLRAAEREEAVGEAINVGTGVETANEDLVRLVEEISGRKVRVEPGGCPPRATDGTHWRADPAKMRRILGLCPRPLEAGLRETIGWWKERNFETRKVESGNNKTAPRA